MKNCVAAGAFGIAVVLWSERTGGGGGLEGSTSQCILNRVLNTYAIFGDTFENG